MMPSTSSDEPMMNPTANITSRRILIALTILGLLVAGYLAYVYIADVEALCSNVGGCDAVKNSRYSHVAGIPVPVIGLAGYGAILLLLLIEGTGGALAEQSPTLVFGLSLLGTLYSAYLTYLELAVIKAICPYCVASAIIMTVILGVAVYRLARIMRSYEEFA